MTTRLPPDLKTEADAYATRLGISLNALLAVALRDYLDRRRRMRPSVEPSETVTVPAIDPQVVGPKALPFPRPHSRSDPCPCGATDQHGRPLKFKHCHGAAG